MIYNWFGLNLSLSMSQITTNLRFTVGGRGKDHSFIPAQASQGARGGPQGFLKQEQRTISDSYFHAGKCFFQALL